MSEIINKGWLTDESGTKFAPKTLLSQVQSSDGTLLEVKIAEDILASKNETLASAQVYTDEQINAIPTPDVSGQIGNHNTDPEAHMDIRGMIAQPDWDQNDESAPDYVKNRTHWAEEAREPIRFGYDGAGGGPFVTENVELSFEDGWANGMQLIGDWVTNGDALFYEGRRYVVVWDGVEYECVPSEIDDGDRAGWWALGNPLGSYPFGVVQVYADNQFYCVYAYNPDGTLETGETTHTMSLYEVTETVHKLDAKYLPAGSAKPFIVTFSSGYDPDVGTVSYADKTFDEIVAAVNSGISVVGHDDNNTWYNLKICDEYDGVIYFTAIDPRSWSVSYYKLYSWDNKVKYDFTPLATEELVYEYVDSAIGTAIGGSY